MSYHNITKFIVYAVFGGYLDIKQKYKGSYLGPLWVTVSIIVFGSVLHLVTKTFYQSGAQNPVSVIYIVKGLLFWNLFSSIIMESSTLYNDNSVSLRETTLLPTALNLRLLVKNLLIMLHNFFGYSILASGFGDFSIYNIAFLLLLLVLFTIPLLFISIVVSFVCTRYTDLKSIISLSLQLLFFLTPIFWIPSHNDLLSTTIPFNIVAILLQISDLDNPIKYSVIFIVYSGILLYLSNLTFKHYSKALVFYL